MRSPAPLNLPARIGATALAALLLLAPALPAAAADIQILEPPRVGEPVPDFTLSDTAGTAVSLAEFRGKVVLLSFWSCHTDTCFTSVKVFEDLLARLGPRGLVAPTICEEIPAALAANGYAGLLQRCSAGQKILIDEQREVRSRLRVRQLPTTIVVGPDFTIREIVRGVPGLRDPAFHARLEELVRQSETPAKP